MLNFLDFNLFLKFYKGLLCYSPYKFEICFIVNRMQYINNIVRELCLWIIFCMQCFIQNSYTIFFVNSIFVLYKVYPVPYRYNFIWVLCYYRIIFKKIIICFVLDSVLQYITQCCYWSSEQWKSITLSSLFKCCFVNVETTSMKYVQ